MYLMKFSDLIPLPFSLLLPLLHPVQEALLGRHLLLLLERLVGFRLAEVPMYKKSAEDNYVK